MTHAGEKVEVWQDSGRVALDHDALEAYVFGQVVERLNATERWRQRMSELDPAIDAAIDDLEVERSDLRAQRERAGKAFVLGVMSERDAQAEVAALAVRLNGIDRRINELLGRPNLADALAHGQGLNWMSWTPGRRRTFLRLTIERVEIGDWPEGISRRTNRRLGESTEAHGERQRVHIQEVMAQRARIVWLDETWTGRARLRRWELAAISIPAHATQVPKIASPGLNAHRADIARIATRVARSRAPALQRCIGP